MEETQMQILYIEKKEGKELYTIAQMGAEDYQSLEFRGDKELISAAEVIGQTESLDDLAERSYRMIDEFKDFRLSRITTVRGDPELDADEEGNLKYLPVSVNEMIYFKEKYIGALQ